MPSDRRAMPDEPPPFLGTWPRVYTVVVVYLALLIMAAQASAITSSATTGQSYVDGMRFVQFYFGMPLAMVALSATVVPIFHRANVYTAYEYLENRFDAKTRALASVIFLMRRGLS